MAPAFREGPRNPKSEIMRKPVILITGAGGEIGHGLIARLAAGSTSPPHRHHRSQSARARARGARAAGVHRIDPRSRTCSSACSPSSRSTPSSIWRRFCRRARSSRRSRRIRSTSKARSPCWSSRSREGESHGRPVTFVYPSSIAAYGLPDLEPRRPARACHRGSVRLADDDVRLQQAVLRAARTVLRDATTSSSRPIRRAARVDFRCVRFPGLISAATAAVGRHVRLRAGDDSCCGARRAIRVFRPAGHADSVHGHAGCRGRAAPAWLACRASSLTRIGV